MPAEQQLTPKARLGCDAALVTMNRALQNTAECCRVLNVALLNTAHMLHKCCKMLLNVAQMLRIVCS